MIESILRFSIERRVLTLSLILLIVVGGSWSYQSLPIDAAPDITAETGSEWTNPLFSDI